MDSAEADNQPIIPLSDVSEATAAVKIEPLPLTAPSTTHAMIKPVIDHSSRTRA